MKNFRLTFLRVLSEIMKNDMSSVWLANETRDALSPYRVCNNTYLYLIMIIDIDDEKFIDYKSL